MATAKKTQAKTSESKPQAKPKAETPRSTSSTSSTPARQHSSTDDLVTCPVCAYKFKPGDPRL